MNDLPFERLRSVPSRKDERGLCGRFWGVVDKGGEDLFLEGGARASGFSPPLQAMAPREAVVFGM
jgi:hypothetical protein